MGIGCKLNSGSNFEKFSSAGNQNSMICVNEYL